MSIQEYSLYSDCQLDTTRSIRLLRIQKSFEDAEVLSCSLESFVINEAPPYTALSYTWGSATTENDFNNHDKRSGCLLDQTLEVNGCALKITSNLFDALLALRKLYQYQYLWIDAICINQADNKERASQIRLMCTIFRSAEEVLGWLGKASDAQIVDVAWFHSTLLTSIRKVFGPKFFSSSSSSELTSSTLNKMELDSLAIHATGLVDLHQRQWFSRVWVAQEVALAENIRLLYGTLFLKYDDVYDVSILWERCDAELRYRVHEHLGMELFIQPYLNVMNCLRDFVKNGRLASPIRNVVDSADQMYVDAIMLAVMLRTWNCTDHRDRFYGLNGILEAVYPCWNTMESRLPIDYSMDVELLYFLAVKNAALRVQSLDFVSFIEDPSQRQLQHLPSWVPDFSVRVRKKCFGTFPRGQAGGICTFDKGYSLYNQRLLVPMIMVGIVEQIHNTTMSENEPFELKSDALGDLMSFCLSMTPIYSTGESRVEALGRTIIANKLQESKEFTARFSSVFFAWLWGTSVDRVFHEADRLLKKTATDVKDESTTSTRTPVSLLCEAATFFRTRYSALNVLASKHPGEVPSTSQVIADITVSFLSVFSLQAGAQAALKKKDSSRVKDARLFANLMSYTSGRRLLKLHTGHIGLGPVSTRPGDQVQILHNCDIPVVLRPCGTFSDHHKGKVLQAYRVIGEVYVHGIMDRKTHDKDFCDSFVELALV